MENISKELVPAEERFYIHFWKKDAQGSMKRITCKKKTFQEAQKLVTSLMGDKTVMGEIESSHDRIYKK